MGAEELNTAGLKFKSTRPEGKGTAFQNATRWKAAGKSGIMLTGIYDGLTEISELTGKRDFKFTALEAGVTLDKEGNEVPFEKGSTVVINAAGNLGYKIENFAEVGDVVQVVYEGQYTPTKGPRKGKELHSFDLKIVEE